MSSIEGQDDTRRKKKRRVRERRDVEQEDILSLFGGISREDGGLNGGWVGDSLVGVDGSVGFLPVEEFRDEPEKEE